MGGKDRNAGDIRLNADRGWAANTALVPSKQSLNARQAKLKASGHIVDLPPHGTRNDKLQNVQSANAISSEMTASYREPEGFTRTDRVVDTTTEVRYRKTKSSFEGDSGRPEMYNR